MRTERFYFRVFSMIPAGTGGFRRANGTGGKDRRRSPSRTRFEVAPPGYDLPRGILIEATDEPYFLRANVCLPENQESFH
jgi:hypothetical protein